MIRPLPLLYQSSSADGRMEWDWLLIFNWKRTPAKQVRWRVFPLLFYESGDEGSFTVFPLFWSYRNNAQKEHAVHVIPPLVISWRRPNEWSMFVAGLYLQSSPESSRANFLYLIDHRKDKKDDEYVFGMLFDFFRLFDHYNYDSGNREFWGLLFHSLSYERQGDRTKLRLAYRLLGGMDYKSPTDYDFNST